MPLLGLLLFLALEVWILGLAARIVGFGIVIALVAGTGVAGTLLARRSSRRLGSDVREVLARSPGADIPARVASAFAPLAAGLLLMMPGFVTDVIGLTLLLPPVRPLWGRVLSGMLVRAAGRAAARSFVFGGTGPQPASPRDEGPPRSGDGRDLHHRHPGERVVEADYEIVE